MDADPIPAAARGPLPGRRRASALTLAALIGVAALVGASLLGLWRAEEDLFGLDLAVGVLACVLLPALLRWPVATALLLGALAGLSPAATPAATASVLLVAQQRRFPLAVAVAVAGVAAHAVQGGWRPLTGLSYAWWLALMAAGYAAVLGWGTLSRARWALVASLRERAHRAETEQARRVAEARALERNRIAREMHDVLAHRLSLVATYAGALEYRPDAPAEQLARAAGVVRAGVHQALTELREVIDVLRDGQPDDGSGAGPQPDLAGLVGLVAEATAAGQRVTLDDRTAGEAPPGLGRTAYRVVQEGLTNARKHAPGQPVRATLTGQPGDALAIEITNPLSTAAPPPGADLPGADLPGSGTGLVGLIERVHLAGGTLTHQATATGEFHLYVRLPWPA